MSSVRVLVVESESETTMDIQVRLAGMKYEPVGHTGSGEEALILVETQRPDLVLMDIHLQGAMDGITAAGEIRRRFRVPVIFLTACSEDETLEIARQAKPFGYIIRPFEDRELKFAIEMALYRHHAEEEILRLNRLYDVLSQVNQTIVRVRTRDELLSTVCRLIVERGGVELAWIGLLDPDNQRICPVAHFGNPGDILSKVDFFADERPEGQGNPGKAIRGGRSFVCNKCAGLECFYPSEKAPARFGFQSCGSFPLRFQGAICGALTLHVAEKGFFREREVNLLNEVAQDISYALDNIERDVQRKCLNEDLRRQSSFLQSLMDAMPHPVFYKDTRLRYLGCNTAFERFHRIERDRIIGKTVYEIWPRDLADLYHRTDQELLESTDPRTLVYEGAIQADDGVRYDVLFHKGVFRDRDGSVGGVIGAMEDITERRRAEKERILVEAQLWQAQKMDALGTLAGGIAHDFNNILGIIIGYTELAELDAGEGSRQWKNLQEVLKATNRARDLVQQILTFSRRREQETKPVQVGLIVKEALNMLRASLPSSIEIRLDVVSRTIVSADPTQIHQVLMNLCTNAAHSMREDGGVLQVSLTDVRLGPEVRRPQSHLQPGPYVKLTVKDTGHGIDPAVLDSIFDPFFTTKEQGAGTGLGLAVVHGIVKSYGGAIDVDTVPGHGAAFHVFLPALECDRAPETVEADPVPRGREKILFVDDEPAWAMAAKQILERLGYEVDCRTNGIEALEAFVHQHEEKRFDLVITDMTMPHFSGEDLARELLKRSPNLSIVLCTGFSEKMDEERAKTLGIRALLMKPVTLRDLAGTVRRVLDERVT